MNDQEIERLRAEDASYLSPSIKCNSDDRADESI